MKGKVLLFLHGWCCEPKDFNSQIDHFNQKYHIISPDYSKLVIDKKYDLNQIVAFLQKRNLNIKK